MKSLAQVSFTPATVIGIPVYAPSLGGMVTITDYIPGNVWGIEVSVDGRPVAWMSADELFIVQVADDVIVIDEDGYEFIGTVTAVRMDSLKAVFADDVTRKFSYRYVSAVLPLVVTPAAFVA